MIAPFVDVDWLERHRGEVMLADCRWYLDGRSGREAYGGGRIPGAVWVDLDTALTRHADPAVAGRHPLPAPEDFATAMGALGIGDDDVVVAYDDAGGVIAARLVWMLRVSGHEAALLDGGLGAWRGELESDPDAGAVGPDAGAVGPDAGAAGPGPGAVDPAPGTRAVGRPRGAAEFTARPWPADRLASIEEVATLVSAARPASPPGPDAVAARPASPPDSDEVAGLASASPAPALGPDAPADPPDPPADPAAVLIDARQHERYLGEPDGVDPRAGHIPGALSVPCRENFDADGRLLPVAELRARFDFGGRADVISYCGSGVTACHNLLAMEQAGLGPGRLFPGSWSQWSRDPARPVQTGGERRD